MDLFPNVTLSKERLSKDGTGDFIVTSLTAIGEPIFFGWHSYT